MRPRKVVLCVDAVDLRLGIRAFMLETWGYRAVKAASSGAAAEILKQAPAGTIDVLLLQAPVPASLTALRAAKARDVPSLVTSDQAFAVHDTNLAHADVVLSKGQWSAPELRERVRIMVARKRGPKKKLPASVANADAHGASRDAGLATKRDAPTGAGQVADSNFSVGETRRELCA